MVKIENEWLSAGINELGAELNSVYHKKLNIDYLWGADPAFWAKKSPVLFPIVGGLKNNKYLFDGREYDMGRHGFARDSTFKVANQTDTAAAFVLKSDAVTRAAYPFDFEFTVLYTLRDATLDVSYEVTNTDRDPMYFSVGGHPAFRLPLEAGAVYDDYYLQFAVEENAGRWPITPDGLIKSAPTPLLAHTRRLPLTKSLFAADALVFKNLQSHAVTLKSDRFEHGLHVDYPGFPYLGVWAAKDANFVCIEPWCGIADSESTTQQLTEKEGINVLQGGSSFERRWSVTLF